MTVPFIRGLLLVIGIVAAAPSTVQNPGVTPAELANFVLFSQYAGAAYCYANYQSTTFNLTCAGDSGSCEDIEGAQAYASHPFILGQSKTAGFIAIDDQHKVIVIAVQGTQLKTNPGAIRNIKLDQVKTRLCGHKNTTDGCSVHGGFYQSALEVRQEVTRAVADAVQANPRYQIVAVGHSLGGVITSLIGAMLRNDGYNVDIYTYGMPHIGGRDVTKYIQHQAPELGNNFRITHHNDVVPQLPRYEWGNWGHTYPEFWITKKRGPISPTDIKKVDGDFFTKSGNEGIGSARGSRDSLRFLIGARKGLDAHLEYFGKISACDSTPPKRRKSKKKGN